MQKGLVFVGYNRQKWDLVQMVFCRGRGLFWGLGAPVKIGAAKQRYVAGVGVVVLPLLRLEATAGGGCCGFVPPSP